MTKAEFVQELFKFYTENVDDSEGISEMFYVKENETEYVYVSFGRSQKRFSVWGDNRKGIMIDFMRFIQNEDAYEWLRPEERKENKVD